MSIAVNETTLVPATFKVTFFSWRTAGSEGVRQGPTLPHTIYHLGSCSCALMVIKIVVSHVVHGGCRSLVRPRTISLGDSHGGALSDDALWTWRFNLKLFYKITSTNFGMGYGSVE
eukprot:2125769-Rhodomonas_salina.3